MCPDLTEVSPCPTSKGFQMDHRTLWLQTVWMTLRLQPADNFWPDLNSSVKINCGVSEGVDG